MTKNYRFWIMWAALAAVLEWFLWKDPNGGLQLATQLQTLVGIVVAVPLTYYLRRFFAEQARGRDLMQMVREGNVAAGLALLGLYILTGLLFYAIVPRALAAAPLPPGAVRDLPILVQEIDARWPAMPIRSVAGALVEQESGWRVQATLKTSREEGAGYGQFTRAYRADGSLRFDALAEVRQMDPGLAGWTWADRFNPRMQLRGVAVKLRDCYHRLRPLVDDDYNALAMCDAAYNGGLGGLYAERRLCAQVHGCDAGRWFGHVELHCLKSKAKWQGYGASACDINRAHTYNVMGPRRTKYIPYMDRS